MWKEVIDASPNIWSSIGNTTPNLERCLTKPENAPLMVALRLTQPHTNRELLNWDRSLEVISRWGIADVDSHVEGARKERYLSALEANPAPMLRSLNLTDYDHNAPYGVEIDLFRGVAPRFRELRLHGISPKNWDSPFFSNLRLLSLSRIHGPTMEQFLEILEACSCLESLTLSFFHVNGNVSALEPRRAVNLLSLDSLGISGLAPATIKFLLRTIKAPFCRDFSIQPARYMGYQDAATCSECINVAFTSFLTTAEDVRVTISTKPSRVYVRATERDKDGVFSVRLAGYSAHSVWSTFVPLLFPETSPVTIELAFGSGDPNVLLETSAWTLHGVWKIVLGLGAERVIQELAVAKAIDDGFRWMWPRLYELSVDGVDGEELLRMLEARAEAVTSGRMLDDQQQRPVPLKLLALGRSCKVSPTILEDIRRFVGEVQTENPD
ncbi:hypothetical protein FRB94_005054 [Tulasnella sp. JGI-2019a]|nr:hypothetical protein FRB94_005054 [Tulasnella sp. JGI-2019a]